MLGFKYYDYRYDFKYRRSKRSTTATAATGIDAAEKGPVSANIDPPLSPTSKDLATMTKNKPGSQPGTHDDLSMHITETSHPRAPQIVHIPVSYLPSPIHTAAATAADAYERQPQQNALLNEEASSYDPHRHSEAFVSTLKSIKSPTSHSRVMASDENKDNDVFTPTPLRLDKDLPAPSPLASEDNTLDGTPSPRITSTCYRARPSSTYRCDWPISTNPG